MYVFILSVLVQWHQEALAYLLRLLCQFAVIQFDEGDGAAGSDVTQTGSSDNSAVVSPAKRVQAVTLIPKLNKVNIMAEPYQLGG